MIEISLSSAFAIYLGLFLGVLFALWIFGERRRIRKAKMPPLLHLNLCEYCHFPYLDKAVSSITTCPQCKSLNKRKKPNYTETT